MTATKTAKKEMSNMAAEIAEAVGSKYSSAFIGTWMDRAGLSLTIRLQSKQDGRRLDVHKWDDEETCTIRYIVGNFWRDPANAQEFAKVTDVAFSADAIAETILEILEGSTIMVWVERDDDWITPPAEPEYEATQTGKQLSDDDEIVDPDPDDHRTTA